MGKPTTEPLEEHLTTLTQALDCTQLEKARLSGQWLRSDHHARPNASAEPTPNHAHSKLAKELYASHLALTVLGIETFAVLCTISLGADRPILCFAISNLVGYLVSRVFDLGFMFAAGVRPGRIASLPAIRRIAVVAGILVLACFSLACFMRFSDDAALLAQFPLLALVFEVGLFTLAAAAKSAYLVFGYSGELCDRYDSTSRRCAELTAAIRSCQDQIAALTKASHSKGQDDEKAFASYWHLPSAAPSSVVQQSDLSAFRTSSHRTNGDATRMDPADGH